MQTLRYKNVYLYRHDILRKIAETGFENDTLLVKNASITKVSPDFNLVRIKGELVFFSFRPEELEERKVSTYGFEKFVRNFFGFDSIKTIYKFQPWKVKHTHIDFIFDESIISHILPDEDENEIQ